MTPEKTKRVMIRSYDMTDVSRDTGEPRRIVDVPYVLASDYDRDLAEMRRQRDEALALLRDIEPYADSMVCYASTINEHLPNGFPARIRAALVSKEPRDG